jgi:hypothetical protein
LCEIHHYAIHGRPERINRQVTGHWIVIDHFNDIFSQTSDNEDDDDDDNFDEYDSETTTTSDENMNSIIELHKEKYASYISSRQLENKKHPIIRNYLEIVSNSNYIQPHIAEVIKFNKANDGNVFYYSLAIIKTIWLKLVQKNWKRIFNERRKIIKIRCDPRSIRYREIHKKWPRECSHLPSLKGMLSTLK